MNQAKIRLSAKEMELVSDPDFILTKNNVLNKAVLVLENLCMSYSELAKEKKEKLPEELNLASSKISRGENYLGLPYRVLDYPAIFSGENILAIRTMFWWGHFFSITLHLAGKYKKRIEYKLIQSQLLQKTGFHICTSKEQWHHHFETNNYTDITNLSEGQLKNEIISKDFVKLAAYIPVTDWDNMPKKMPEQFRHFIEIISD